MALRHRRVLAAREQGWNASLRRLEREVTQMSVRLAQRARGDGRNSRAEEWLLDNWYLVEEAAPAIVNSLGRHAVRRLPVVSGPHGQPVLRIHELAETIEAGCAGPLSSEGIQRYVEAYQARTPLTIAELWALPACLRLVLVAGLVATGRALLGDGERASQTEVSVDRIAQRISGLRNLAGADWRVTFENMCCVDRVLGEDPAAVYPAMDFESRNQYRERIEELARGGNVGEIEAARAAITLSRQRSSDDPRRHVGYFLLGAGRHRLDAACGYRTRDGGRVARLLLARPSAAYFGLLASTTVALWALLAHAAFAAAPGRLAAAALIVAALLPLAGLSVALVHALVTFVLPPRRLPRLQFERGIPRAFRSVVVVPVLLREPGDVDAVFRRLELNHLNNPDPQLAFAVLGDLRDADRKHCDDDAAVLARGAALTDELNRRYSDAPFLFLNRQRRWNPADRLWMGWERKRGKLMAFNRLLAGDVDTDYTTRHGSVERLREVRFVITLDADTMMPAGTARALVGILAHPLNGGLGRSDDGSAGGGYGILQPRLEIDPEGARPTAFTHVMSGDTTLDLYTHAVSDTYQDLFGEGLFAGKGIYDWRAVDSALSGRIPDNLVLSHDLLEGLHAGVGLASDVVLLEGFPATTAAWARRQHRWVRGDWQLIAWLAPRVRDATGRYRCNPLTAIQRWQIVDNLRRSLQPIFTLSLLILVWVLLAPAQAAAGTLLVALLTAAPLMIGMLRLTVSCIRHPKALRTLVADAAGPLLADLEHALLHLLLLPNLAFIIADAIGRALWRQAISGRRLLEWITAAHTDASAADSPPWREFWQPPLLALFLGFALAWTNAGALPVAAPLLIGWLASPWIVRRLNRCARPEFRPLEADERLRLRRWTLATWRFFDRVLGPDDHWLPPDCLQEAPAPEVIRRTSPTNMGMALVSMLAAYDRGYLDLPGLVATLRNTLDNMARLQRHRGHWLNWYATRDLQALRPRYVSTVDSGNLAGSLLVVARGLDEITASEIDTAALRDGFVDALRSLAETCAGLAGTDSGFGRDIRQHVDAVVERLESLREGANTCAELQRVAEAARSHLDECIQSWLDREGGGLPGESLVDLHDARELLRRQCRNVARFHRLFQPWLEPVAWYRELSDGRFDPPPALLEHMPRTISAAAIGAQSGAVLDGLRTIENDADGPARAILGRARARLRESAREIASLHGDAGDLAASCERFATEMDFAFLYDAERDLFRIGCDVDAGRLDANCYDLLASEARLASLVAVSRRQVPTRHWVHLGRPFRRWRGERVLMSWSATLFEYLMPNLFMRVPAHTLLERGCRSAVHLHRRFARRYRIPWGIAESGYNRINEHGHYQYRAFGVPGLGLRRDLGDRLVVAPYASALALSIATEAALRNLVELERLGSFGRYGFYEALDFGRADRAGPRRGHVVRSFMSHHQGMIMTALNNALTEDAAVRRFHADRRIRSVAMLLHERIPSLLPRLPARKRIARGSAFGEDGAPVSWSAPPEPGSPCANLLSNGRLHVFASMPGGGAMYWQGASVLQGPSFDGLRSGGPSTWLRDCDTGELARLDQFSGKEPSACQAEFGPHALSIHTRASGLACRLSMAVASQHDLVVRRFTLTNETDRIRRLLLTDLAEPMLASAADWDRHPAFARLFLVCEAVPEEHALLFRRRRRSPAERGMCVGFAVVPPAGVDFRVGWQSERERAIGRGRGRAAPAILERGFIGFTDSPATVPLDPVACLGLEIVAPPLAQVDFALICAVAESREQVLAVLSEQRSMSSVVWTFEQAWLHAAQEMHDLGIEPAMAEGIMQLLGAIAMPRRRWRRAPPDSVASTDAIQPVLWARAVSGDSPIVVVRVGSARDVGDVEALLQAHTFLVGRGLRCDLILLDADSQGYLQPSRDRLTETVNAVRARSNRSLAGAVHVVVEHELQSRERELLLGSARVVLDTSAGDFLEQLRSRPRESLPPLVTVAPVERDARHEGMEPEPLAFDNGFGGFGRDGREYVIHDAARNPPPAPWINVLANPDFGALVTEAGLACTWAANSAEYRLSPWSNDPVCDPPGEAIYVRDEETGEFWSAAPRPVPAAGAYRVAHGAGYSTYAHRAHGLAQVLRIHVDRREPLKFMRLEIANRRDQPRRITVTCLVRWVLGNSIDSALPFVQCEHVPEARAILARNAYLPGESGRVAFLASEQRVHGFTVDLEEFLGEGGLERPAALARIGLSDAQLPQGAACAALQVHLDLPARGSGHALFVLGAGNGRDDAVARARRAATATADRRSVGRAREEWETLLGTVQVDTPDASMNLLLNRWLLYQAVSARLFARTGFWQPSGAYGFRDQLQDVMALVWSAPDLVRDHILHAASRQFEAGDVLHWWHEDPLRGIRTRCSDDLVWLPYVTAHYVRATGDRQILDQHVPWLQGDPLNPDESERFGQWDASPHGATLHQHCCRALDRAATVGPHGLPTIGSGDWNDGFNRVSCGGRGESVWLGWFLARAWRDYANCCDALGDTTAAEHYRRLARVILGQIEREAWDGRWYKRAFFDDGAALGSAANRECRIDLIAQCWAVLARDRPHVRARRAMHAALAELTSDTDRLILLLSPPFDRTARDPGYIKGYPPGIRENGAQYTHAATWAVWAMAELGDGDCAMRLFSLLDPIKRARSGEGAQRYRLEPYVLAGDVYSQPPHRGRGGWSWYSGAAAWLYRAGLEAILGLKLDGGRLRVDPCLPSEWPGYSATIRRGGSRYRVEVSRAGPRQRPSITIDGRPVAEDSTIALPDDGAEHRIRVVIAASDSAVSSGGAGAPPVTG